jgi:DNA-binding NarL/FixJ family response regulator
MDNAIRITHGHVRDSVAAGEVSSGSLAVERGFSVLLVDDSRIFCDRLSELIHQRHRSIRVVVAQDGTRVREELMRLRPAAVVLEIALPDTSGFDLIALVKLQNPACVVIVLTIYAYPELRDNALRLGADHFFSKTMEFERATEVLGALAAPPSFGDGAMKEDRP